MQDRYPYAISRARGLINEYMIFEPKMIDIEGIAIDQGIYIIDDVLEGASARLFIKRSSGFIRVSDAIRETGQRRFCIAHELGHFLLHNNINNHELIAPELVFYSNSKQKQESEANAFASELLMPMEMFHARCLPGHLSWGNIQDLSSQFQTTLTATALRYVNCGPSICALVVSKNGSIQWFQKGVDFRFNILDLRTEVHHLTGAGEFFHSGEITEDLMEVPVECWLDDPKIDRTWTIGELTFALPRYETAVTILWPIPGSALDQYDEEDNRY